MNQRFYLTILPVILLVMAVSGCSTTKDVAYVQTAENEMIIASNELHEARIMPKDIVTITIQANSPDAVAAFNGIYWSPNQQYNTIAQQIRQFLVDNDGKVDLPVIGLLDLSGLTIREAETKIKLALKKYIKEVTSVNLQIKNYRYSVIGEVNRPGTFIAENTKVTIFEALANAGDMTIYGLNREIQLMREESDGSKRLVTLDLQDTSILSSPYYYLQQGDVIYVKPNNAKASNRNISSGTTIWVSIASLGFSLANIIVTLLR